MAYARAVLFVALGLGADGPGDSKVRPQYEALVKAYEADVKAWEAKYPPAGKDVDLVARYRDWPGWTYAPRVLALAEMHPQDPAAVDALLWVVGLRDRVGAQDRGLWPHYERALTLLRDHLQDPRVDRDTYLVVGRGITPGSEDFLRFALEKGRDRDVRGCACLALARSIATRREIALNPWFDRPKTPFMAYMVGRFDPGYPLYIRGADAEALATEAAHLYARADREFGDVVARKRGDVAETVGTRARGGLRELLTLTIGRIAPEIEGPDASGERLSLHGQRGKVVVVAVSQAGDVELHGQLRALIERHKGEPFVVLGVSVDPNKAALDGTIKLGVVTWRSWWDGQAGPIVSAWRGSNVPRFLVLDDQGVIRARENRVDDLDETVDRLLAERKAKP